MGARSKEALENQRRQCRESYYWYKAAGLCPRCHTAWAVPGRVYCKSCAQKNRNAVDYGYNSSKSRERRERMKAQGLCVNCGKRDPIPGQVLCPTCRRKNLESIQARKIRDRLKKEAQS